MLNIENVIVYLFNKKKLIEKENTLTTPPPAECNKTLFPDLIDAKSKTNACATT